MRTLGIDVSHYQGDINWLQVARSDVKFAFAKASDGTGVDDHFQKNWLGIQEVGLYRGAYHFGRPGFDPETQAVHFASVVGALGFRDLPPFLDLEVSGGHDGADVLEWARAFVMKAEALLGRKLIVYTGEFWRGSPRFAAPTASVRYFAGFGRWVRATLRRSGLAPGERRASQAEHAAARRAARGGSRRERRERKGQGEKWQPSAALEIRNQNRAALRSSR